MKHPVVQCKSIWFNLKWHSSAQPFIIGLVFLLQQISCLRRAHQPRWPPSLTTSNRGREIISRKLTHKLTQNQHTVRYCWTISACKNVLLQIIHKKQSLSHHTFNIESDQLWLKFWLILSILIFCHQFCGQYSIFFFWVVHNNWDNASMCGCGCIDKTGVVSSY